MGLPAQATATAGDVDRLFMLIQCTTSSILIVVLAILVYALIRFRAGRSDRAKHSTGSARVEVVLALVSFAVLMSLAFMSAGVWDTMTGRTMTAEPAALVVEIRPRQFQWDIRYSGNDERFGTSDDIVAINQLHVPAGVDIELRLESQDVIHSFFVPEFRMKQDAVPGMTVLYRFKVDRPDTFQIACAELCGLGHYRMMGYLTVHDPDSFRDWYVKRSLHTGGIQ